MKRPVPLCLCLIAVATASGVSPSVTQVSPFTRLIPVEAKILAAPAFPGGGFDGDNIPVDPFGRRAEYASHAKGVRLAMGFQLAGRRENERQV
jgi:hypothetical protein